MPKCISDAFKPLISPNNVNQWLTIMVQFHCHFVVLTHFTHEPRILHKKSAISVSFDSTFMALYYCF